jgi:phospholipid transport system substrate-binding protein
MVVASVFGTNSMPPRGPSSATGSLTQASAIVQRPSIWSRCGASLVLLLLLGAVSSAAPLAASPLATVKTTLKEALAILHDQQMPVERRRRSLLELAQHNLDFERMGRASLGEHWSEMTAAEQHEFVALFGAFIEAAYLTQIQDYVALNIDVSKEQSISPDYALVDATVIQPHEEPLPITFMLERHGSDWMVYDVAVDSVSMVENYRAQFDRVIKRQGLQQLLDDLRAKQKQLSALIGKE